MKDLHSSAVQPAARRLISSGPPEFPKNFQICVFYLKLK